MNARTTAIFAAALAWSAGMFGTGMLYRQHQLLRAPFVTTKKMELAVGASAGTLPVGTPLYDYDGPEEQPIFVVFVGTKDLASLEPAPGRHWLELSPLVASAR